MKIKKITITEQYENDKTRKFDFPVDSTKTIFQNAKYALRTVCENAYFADAKIAAKNDPSIYTHEDYEDVLAENEKEYMFCWWGKKYDAGVEISVIVEE